MADPVASLHANLSASTAGFESGMKRAQGALSETMRELSKFGKTLRTMGAEMESAGRGLSLSVSAPLALLGGAAVKAAVSFESAFAGVRKTVDGSEADFKALEKGIRDLSKEIPIAAEELAGIAEAAGALGVAKEDTIEFTKTVAMMARTTDLSADEAANAFARIGLLSGAVEKEGSAAFNRMGSAMVALGKSGASTEKDIAAVALRLVSAGRAAGLEAPQILGFAASVSDVGFEAEAGGTALSKFFNDIVTNAAQGGEGFEVMAALAGKSTKDLAEQVENDFAGAFQSIIAGLGKLQGADLQKAFAGLGVQDDRRVTDLLTRLALASDKVGKSVATAGEEWRKGSALTEAASKKFATAESQFVLLKNKVLDVARTIGAALLPSLLAIGRAFDAALPTIQKFADAFGKSSATTQLTVGFLGLAAVISGPLMIALGSLAGGIGNIIALWVKLSRTTVAANLSTGVTAAFGSISTAATGLAARMPILTASISATGAGISNALAPAAAAVGGSFAALGVVAAATGLAFYEVGTAAIKAGDFVRYADDPIKTATLNVNLFSGAWALLGDAFGATLGFFGSIGGTLADLAGAFGEIALRIPIVSGLVEAGGAAWRAFGEILSAASEKIFALGKVLYGTGQDAQGNAAYLAQASKMAGREITTLAEAQAVYAEAAKKAAAAGTDAAAEKKALAAASKVAGYEVKTLAEAEKLYAEEGKKAAALAGGEKAYLAKATKIAGHEVKSLGEAYKVFAKQAEKSALDVDKLNKRLAEQKEREAAAKAEATALKNELDRLTGADIQEKADRMNKLLAMPGVFEQATRNKQAIGHLADEIRKLEKEGARVGPQLQKVLDLDVPEITGRRSINALALSDSQLAAQAKEQAARKQADFEEKILVTAREQLDTTRRETEAREKARAILEAENYTVEEINEVLGEIEDKTLSWGEHLSIAADWLGYALQNVGDLVSQFGDADSLAGKLGSTIAGIGGSVRGMSGGFEDFAKAGEMGGPLGLLGQIGAGVQIASAAIGIGKAIVGLFKADPVKQAQKQVAKELGFNISKELAEAIVKEGGDPIAGALKHLGEIIDEAGGIEKFGFNKAIAGVGELFAAVKAGTVTLEEAGATFDDVFSKMAASLEETGELASLEFLGMINAATDAGIKSKALTDYMRKGISGAISGIQTFLETSKVSSQAAATGIAGALTASFAALQNAGVPLREAIAQMGPSILALQEQLAAAGYTGGAAFDQLLGLAALAADEMAGPALDGAHGLASAIKDLHNTGLLTQEMFAGLSTQITDTFNKLVAEGKDPHAVMQLMRGDLQTLWEMAHLYGMELDENTKKLVDEAEKSGQVGEKFVSAQERSAQSLEKVADLLEAIAQKMGVVIQKTNEFGDAAGNAANRAGGGGSSNTVAPGEGGRRYPEFQHGGAGDFGGGTLALLHGREYIIPEAALEALRATSNTFYIDGARDPKAVAREVAAILDSGRAPELADSIRSVNRTGRY